MFGLSFSELLIIGVVGLVVLGPERLPQVAKTVGQLIGRLQRSTRDIKNDIQREIDMQSLSDLKQQVDQSAQAIEQAVTPAVGDLPPLPDLPETQHERPHS